MPVEIGSGDGVQDPGSGRFNEGFDTGDLKAPKALLDALAEPYALREPAYHDHPPQRPLLNVPDTTSRGADWSSGDVRSFTGGVPRGGSFYLHWNARLITTS